MFADTRGLFSWRSSFSARSARRKRLHRHRGRVGWERLEERTVLDGALTPAILGTVYVDLNEDGVPGEGEALPGVTVQLYQDDGDGLFQLDRDSLVETVVSDDEGGYRFEELDPDASFFVRRPQQTVAQLSLPTVISPLIWPGEPSLIIDQFQTRQVVMAEPPAPSRDSSTLLLQSEQEVIGRERDLQAELVSGIGGVELRVNPFGLEGLLEFNQSPGTIGTSLVTWDGVDGDPDRLSMGLRGRDLTQDGSNDGIMLRAGVDASGDGSRVVLRIYENDAQTFSEASVALPVTGGDASGFLFIPFDSFQGPVSPTRVDAIQMAIGEGGEGADGKIDLIAGLGPHVFHISEVVTADLSVTKSNGVETVLPGQTVVYVMTARNAGPNPVAGARVLDKFPSTLTDIQFISTTEGNVSGNTTRGHGDIDDQVDMDVASSITYTVTAKVREDIQEPVDNLIEIVVPQGVRDTNIVNNTARDRDPIGRGIDLSATKDDGRREVMVGETLTYQIVIRNHGPGPVAGAQVTDFFPDTLDGVSYVSTGTTGVTGNTPQGTGDIDDTVNIPEDGRIDYVVTATVSDRAIGTLVNRVTVTAPPDRIELTPEDNIEIDTNLVFREIADVSITKNNGVSEVVPGEQVTYSIVVTNHGPANASQVNVRDDFPDVLQDVRYTSTTVGLASGNTASGQGPIDDLLILAPDAGVVYTATGTVSPSATGVLSNTVTASLPTGDPDPGNNSATDEDPLIPTADLIVTKSDGLAQIDPGQPLTYTIVVQNDGPSDAPGVRVQDSFPQGLTDVTYLRDLDGVITEGTGDLNELVDLPAGQSVIYTVSAIVRPGASATLRNTASVGLPAGVTDPNLQNNTATDITAISRQPVDLLLRKTSAQTVAIPGAKIQYTLIVSNVGQTDVAGAIVSDTFAPELTEVTFTSETIGLASGNTPQGSGNLQETVDLAVGASIIYTIEARLAAHASDSLRNLAQVDLSGQVDATPGNNLDLDVLPVVPHADLSISKTDQQLEVEVGDALTYTIVVQNAGPSDARDVRVSDLIPAGLQQASYTSDGSPGVSGNTPEGNGSIDDLVLLPAGSTLTYQLSGQVAADVSGVLVNTARVAGPMDTTFVELDPSNNVATDVNMLASVLALGSEPTVIHRDAIVEPGSTDHYRITAHATGKLLVSALFDHELGDLELAIDDHRGNPLALANTQTSDEYLAIPVVSQQTYFIRVYGATEEITNVYDLEVENFAVPVPEVIRLTPDSDTGRRDDDAVTADAAPTILLQADLADFVAIGLPILEPEDPENDNTSLPSDPGFAVEVILTHTESNNRLVGFASLQNDSATLFSFTPLQRDALASGLYIVTAAVRGFDDSDPGEGLSPTSGRGPLSSPFSMTIDFVAPMSADRPDLVDSSDTGISFRDDVTSKTQPALQGTGEPNTHVRVLAQRTEGDVQVVGQGVVNPDGRWEVTVEPLADDVYELSAEFEDLAGNVSSPGEILVVTVDTMSPNTPYLDLLPSTDTGISASDNVTASDTLAFSMTSEDPAADRHLVPFNYRFRLFLRPDAAVEGITPEEQLIYDSSLDLEIPLENLLDGLTDLTQLTRSFGPLPEGVHNFKLEVEDRAGNVSQDYLLDVRIGKSAPEIGPIRLAKYSDTGVSDEDRVTSLRQPAVLGTGSVGDQVLLRASGEIVGRTLVGSDDTDGIPDDGRGAWEITVEPLADGVYSLVAQVEDLTGNSADSSPLQIEIDTLQPNTPFLDLRESDDTGRHNDDNITAAERLVLSATTSDPNADLHLQMVPGGQNLNYRLFVRPESGEESLVYDSASDPALENLLDGLTAQNQVLTTALSLPEGLHDLKLEVEDRAGNISDDFLLDLLIDRTAFPGDGQVHPASVAGISGTPGDLEDGVISTPTPRFVGTAEADALVTVTVNGQPAGTTVAVPLDGDDALQPPDPPYVIAGNWEMTSSAVLDDGVHEVVFTFEDPAGNRSTSTLQLTVDTHGPTIVNVTRNEEGYPSLFDPKPAGGPDPLIDSLVIHFSDGFDQDSGGPLASIPDSIAGEEGHYLLVGDANGHIAISNVRVETISAGPDAAMTRVVLHFPDPLPDDRYTLTVSDGLTDLAGNRLDGESGARAPFEGRSGLEPVSPIFPTGDQVAGGSFVARFTVDSRPEVGSWSAGSVWTDTNGNFTFDPQNSDLVNRDIVYHYGFTSDDVFAGNFSLFPDDLTDGYDKLAVYGRFDGHFRWLVDTDNDGVPNIDREDPLVANGLPVAGRFDANDVNGDEVAVFDGRVWYFDTDHDFLTDRKLTSSLTGYPVVGDFDGDGFDDLATWTDNRFMVDVADGSRGGWDGHAEYSFNFGFTGVRERPVAADMNQDGVDDLGLWVPDREGASVRNASEWYFLISDGQSLLKRLSPQDDPINSWPTVDFTPRPFGRDLYVQFGDEFALPVVGNFDPPTASLLRTDRMLTNPSYAVDVNDDGAVSPLDALLVINELNQTGPRQLHEHVVGTPYLDVNQDGFVSSVDALLVLNELNAVAPADPQPLAATAVVLRTQVASALLADEVFAATDFGGSWSAELDEDLLRSTTARRR